METNQYQDDEISLKDLILKIQEYFKEVIKYWWIILAFILLCGGYSFYKWYTSKVYYNATLSFMLSESEGESGGMASVFNNFSFGGSPGDANLLKVITL